MRIWKYKIRNPPTLCLSKTADLQVTKAVGWEDKVKFPRCENARTPITSGNTQLVVLFGGWRFHHNRTWEGLSVGDKPFHMSLPWKERNANTPSHFCISRHHIFLSHAHLGQLLHCPSSSLFEQLDGILEQQGGPPGNSHPDTRLLLVWAIFHHADLQGQTNSWLTYRQIIGGW